MKTNSIKRDFRCTKTVAIIAIAGALVSAAAIGQTIPNPSFETDNFAIYPGMVADNGPITGWTVSDPGRAGLNPAGGGSLYADNGAVPDGTKVAFVVAGQQGPVTLSTTMSGLTAGQKYIVTFRANAQTPIEAAALPIVHVTAAGQEIWSMICVDRKEANPYGYLAFEFTATAATEPLSIANDSLYDTALLVDDFKIAPSTGKWTIAAWNDDASSGVDPSFTYTHAYSFGSTASPFINAIQFTGIGGINPSVAGRFSTANFGNVFGDPDANNFTGNSSVLADTFIYQGGDISNRFQTIVISGLTSGKEYVATLYTVAWENASTGTRWMTLEADGNYFTVNQDTFNDNNGITCAYRYTANASGEVTIRIAPVQPNNTSMHIYGFSNREAVASNVKPEISQQPAGITVAEGIDVTFKVSATGFPVPTYQWRFNGADITGANADTYTLTAAPANAGNYDVVVANIVGSVTSQVARLTVGLPMTNPSFEADLFTVAPGYVSGNTPITGWASEGGHGINPVSDGQSPFADTGVIPHGRQVAFMQADGALSQLVSGFTVGGEYYVHYYENGRTGTEGALEVKVGNVTVLPAHRVSAVGAGNPYHEVLTSVFTATATELQLSFVKSNPLGGDSTVVIDNVTIIPVAAGTAPSFSVQPQPATAYVGESVSFSALAQGSLPLSYQWRLNGAPIPGATETTLAVTGIDLADEGDYTVVVTNSSGSATSVVAHLTLMEKITSLHSTGIDAAGAPLAAGVVDPSWTLLTNPDGGTPEVYVANEGWPIQAGVWMVNSATSKWVGSRAAVSGAIPPGAFLYRTTFDLTGRDTNTVIINGQWASDDGGSVVAVNGTTVSVPLSTGFGGWTAFAITSSQINFLPGINTLDFGLNNGDVGPSGVRVEFTRTSARTLPGVPAGIGAQPQGGTYNEGDTVILTVTATGTLPITYQWSKNGANLAGKTDATLTLASVTAADSGSYQVRVANQWGNALSASAVVNVAYRAIPGITGTGVGLNGQLLAQGEIDPHFIIGSSPDPDFQGPNAIVVNDGWPIQPGVWLPNGPNSKWIAPQANQGGTGGGNLGGAYTYQTSFDLTGYDLSKVQLVGGWAADDGSIDILVNGISTGLANGGFGGLTAFVITNNLVAGVNTIDFQINNSPGTGPNPTGIRVDLKGLVPIDQQPTLQITRSGNNLSISWSPDSAGVKLQSATSTAGPWNDVQNQTNPYNTTVTGTMQFFRLTH
jgi:hypothetical protein